MGTLCEMKTTQSREQQLSPTLGRTLLRAQRIALCINTAGPDCYTRLYVKQSVFTAEHSDGCRVSKTWHQGAIVHELKLARRGESIHQEDTLLTL